MSSQISDEYSGDDEEEHDQNEHGAPVSLDISIIHRTWNT